METAFLSFLLARLLSGCFNIIHDCDEVYNYWEPLHRLIYGYGKEPWEYDPQFALRPYAFVMLYWIVAFPVSLLVGNARGKIIVFYFVRTVLALISAFLDARLYKSATKLFPDLKWILWTVLVFSAGYSVASTSFLPNTFVMHCMTGATLSLLEGNTYGLIFSSVLAVMMGWPVAGIAFLPYIVYVLTQPRLKQSFVVLFLSLVLIGVPLLFCDVFFYGKPTVSLWNFVLYNVIGGGQSSLYGVESVDFYLRNGIRNFNIVLLLQCFMPIGLLLAFVMISCRRPREGDEKNSELLTASNLTKLTVACLPAYLWILAISLLPHKEERFLYVVYAQISLGGSLCLGLMVYIMKRFPLRVISRSISIGLTALLLSSYCILSLSRTAALWTHYRAPMDIYLALPATNSQTREYVCTGDRWYEFPSSFFLPSPNFRLGYLRQNFTGMLPADYSEERMGTRVHNPDLNDQNRQSDSSYIPVVECKFVIDLESPSTEQSLSVLYDHKGDWKVLYRKPYLDRDKSPPLTRGFYIPFMNSRLNTYGMYTLYSTS